MQNPAPSGLAWGQLGLPVANGQKTTLRPMVSGGSLDGGRPVFR